MANLFSIVSEMMAFKLFFKVFLRWLNAVRITVCRHSGSFAITGKFVCGRSLTMAHTTLGMGVNAEEGTVNKCSTS